MMLSMMSMMMTDIAQFVVCCLQTNSDQSQIYILFGDNIDDDKEGISSQNIIYNLSGNTLHMFNKGHIKSKTSPVP